jgi:hypothetical protein
MGGAYAALTAAFPSKPFAFTEVGLFPGNQACPIPAPANFANLIAGIKANMPKVTFFMFWKDIWTMGNACDVTTPNASVGTLLSDSWIINKGGVRLRALNPGVPFRSVGPP